jgi:pimeloyl-ACP methyl ester carboxylesterase
MEYRHHVKIYGQEHSEWMILVHGAGGSTQMWYPQIKVLKKHFRLFVYDLRGHGLTGQMNEHDESEYTEDLIVEDLRQLMDEYNIERAHFLGISMGTGIIQHFCMKYPKRFLSMILGGVVTRYQGFSRFLFKLTDKLLIHFLPKDSLYTIMAHIILPGRGCKGSRRLFIRESRKLKVESFYKWWKLCARMNIYPMLPEIDIPTAVVMGSNDFTFMKASLLLKNKFTELIHHVIEGSSHVCNIDGAEEFNQFVIQFCNSVKTRTKDNLETA